MIKQIFMNLLLIPHLRFLYIRLRYKFLKKNIQVLKTNNSDIGKDTIEYNAKALDNPGAFGMDPRMGLLLLPIAAFLLYRSKNILIVGPRTEDDIFWAKGLGLNPLGLDLFSYSQYIELGDIHKTRFKDNSFDAVLLAWMISYSSNPEEVILECKRILKYDGYLGIGLESNWEQKVYGKIENSPRVNTLNGSQDIINMTKMEPVYIYDDNYYKKSYNTAVILRSTIKKDIELKIKQFDVSNKKIVIYGYGEIGKMVSHHFSDNIVAIIDKNYIEINKTSDIEIKDIKIIESLEYDFIIITAIGREKQITEYLTQSFQVDYKKIMFF